MVQEQLKVKTPEHVSVQFRLAGLGSRGAALIIDTVLLTLMQVGLIALLMFMDLQFTGLLQEGRNFYIAIVVILIFLINWGYFFLFELLSGGKTLGKMLIGVRVVQEKGGNATALSLLIRNLLRIIDMLPLYYFAGMLMVFFHPEHKRLGDLVAGTIVVHERKKRKSSKKKKATTIEKEIDERGLSVDDLSIDHFRRQSLTKREWDLLKAYVERFSTLSGKQRDIVTYEVASILLPKLDLEEDQLSIPTLEDRLLIIYLILREDWEFEW